MASIFSVPRGFRLADDPCHLALVLLEECRESGGIHRRLGPGSLAFTASEFVGGATGVRISKCHRRLLSFLWTMPQPLAHL